MTVKSASAAKVRSAKKVVSSRPVGSTSTEGLSLLGRLGLAGRTAFYAILTGLTVRIAMLGGASKDEADAHGALALVSRPVVGKIAIAAVALGFVLFGAGRLVGAFQDDTVSTGRRWMTGAQGVFYLVLAYVPASFLAGNQQTGSQQQQQTTTARLLNLPGGRGIVVLGAIVLMVVCAVQIRGAVKRNFEEGLELDNAPRPVRRVAAVAGVVGISARALVFLPIGIFLIVAAVQYDPRHAYGTDGELLRLTQHTWGVAVVALVAVGLAVFVVYSGIETRYRRVVSAR